MLELRDITLNAGRQLCGNLNGQDNLYLIVKQHFTHIFEPFTQQQTANLNTNILYVKAATATTQLRTLTSAWKPQGEEERVRRCLDTGETCGP